MEINRRDILKFALMTPLVMTACKTVENTVAATKNGVIKPKRIVKGSTVGIIAPGTNVPDPDDISKAIEVLDYFGLKYKVAASLESGTGYKSRTPAERAQDFNNMFSDGEIDAVFCIRGGYGSSQILDLIDYESVQSHPKVFLGYSDITSMHTAIFKKTGLITFHGPVLLSQFTNYTLENFNRVFFEDDEYINLNNPSQKNGLREQFHIRTIQSGIATGRLLGGNLSLISSLSGTKYQPEFVGAIVYLEDVGEAPYRIDRMLNQLKMSSILDGINGIIFGKCEDCDAGTSQSTWDLSLGEVLDNYIKPLKVPSFYGLMIGHTSNQLTLPNGCLVEINADKGNVKLKESPFA